MLTQVRFISFWLPHSLITEELLRLAKDIYDQFVMRELLIRQRRKEKDLRKGDFVPFLKFPTKSTPLYQNAELVTPAQRRGPVEAY